MALAAFETDMLYATAQETAAGITLYMNHEARMMAQWMALPEETQEKWMEDMGDDKEMDMRAYFGF